ncbi:MAG: transcriptional regulator [Desulfuromonadaceae bacterium]|nr:transcriptional regulator [Desulfuromonadaceae bacterium]MDD2854962.1 transcriptional regulator [Desulfuromonadaceae bacterium]
MIRFIMVGLLFYIGYRIIVSITSSKISAKASDKRDNNTTETYIDPICGLYVSAEDAVVGKLDGERHYFCSMNCLEKFRDKLDQTSKQ